MFLKGRLQVGADADITIFNPASIIEHALDFKEDHAKETLKIQL